MHAPIPHACERRLGPPRNTGDSEAACVLVVPTTGVVSICQMPVIRGKISNTFTAPGRDAEKLVDVAMAVLKLFSKKSCK
jgi:hypothetical protein